MDEQMQFHLPLVWTSTEAEGRLLATYRAASAATARRHPCNHGRLNRGHEALRRSQTGNSERTRRSAMARLRTGLRCMGKFRAMFCWTCAATQQEGHAGSGVPT